MAEEEILGSGISDGEPIPDTIDQENDVDEYVEALNMMDDRWVVMPRGKLGNKQFYEPPKIKRGDYIKHRTREAFDSEFFKFEPLDKKKFIHIKRNDSLNYYPLDTRLVMNLLYRKVNRPLYVINGFRSTMEGMTNAHTAGLALDFLAHTKKEAEMIAHAAWSVGIRSIAIQGDFEEGEGFVHVDIGPASQFSFEGKSYQGPGG